MAPIRRGSIITFMSPYTFIIHPSPNINFWAGAPQITSKILFIVCHLIVQKPIIKCGTKKKMETVQFTWLLINPNAPNSNGDTPIETAALFGHLEITRILLSHRYGKRQKLH